MLIAFFLIATYHCGSNKISPRGFPPCFALWWHTQAIIKSVCTPDKQTIADTLYVQWYLVRCLSKDRNVIIIQFFSNWFWRWKVNNGQQLTAYIAVVICRCKNLNDFCNNFFTTIFTEKNDNSFQSAGQMCSR